MIELKAIPFCVTFILLMISIVWMVKVIYEAIEESKSDD